MIQWRNVAIGVSSASIVDALKDSDDINAHMAIHLIPAVYLLQLMRNFNSNIPLFENAKEFFSLTKADETKAWKVLVCEGTGKQRYITTPQQRFIATPYTFLTFIFYVLCDSIALTLLQ